MGLIEVDTIDDIIQGVSGALDICEEDLFEWINKYGDDSEAIEEFVLKNYSKDNRIEKIYFCHLSKMLEPPSALIPLNELLLNESLLSNFLKERGILFFRDTVGIAIKYKGKVWNSNNLKTGNGLLERRLGYGASLDYQPCGFLFAVGIEKEENDYFERLKEGAEFLQCLDSLLGTKLAMLFAKKAKYYMIECVVSIKNAHFLFGSTNYKSIEEKERAYLCECIKYIFSYKFNSKLRNPIIELRNVQSVQVYKYREIL